jgi:hypothetical protein
MHVVVIAAAILGAAVMLVLAQVLDARLLYVPAVAFVSLATATRSSLLDERFTAVGIILATAAGIIIGIVNSV